MFRPFAALLLLSLSSVALATFTIQVNYSGNPVYAPFFTSAASTWQSLLGGYRDGALVAVSSGSHYTGFPSGTPLAVVKINASIPAIDGVGGVLGSAGPTAIGLDSSSFRLTTDGEMEFDSADVANLVSAGVFDDVVLHEMAHVLGFGTLWTLNGVYANGTGEFTGPFATALWQSEFGQSGTPDIELGGGPGTANGHWNEVDGGAGPTGITDGLGNDMRSELMTGWLNTSPAPFISDMTIASFVDIGFAGSLSAIPEGTSFAFVALMATATGLRSRQR
jgi:hypothetical protein